MRTEQQQTPTLHELSRDECFTLLRSQPIGRLAIAVPDRPPLVIPVNFVLDGEAIVFRSNPGTKLEWLDRGPVSFQVDGVDWMHRSGWSVLASGRAYRATHFEVDHLLVDSWSGDKRHWVRIAVSEVTGRRLEQSDWDWMDSRGYL